MVCGRGRDRFPMSVFILLGSEWTVNENKTNKQTNERLCIESRPTLARKAEVARLALATYGTKCGRHGDCLTYVSAYVCTVTGKSH